MNCSDFYHHAPAILVSLPLVIQFFKFHYDFQTIAQNMNETSPSPCFNSYSSFALGYS